MRTVKRLVVISLILTLFLFLLSACGNNQSDAEEREEALGQGEVIRQGDAAVAAEEPADEIANEEEITMMMTINDTAVTVAWDNNASVRALAELAGNGPLTIQLNAYGGFEQVGPIGTALPSNDTSITTESGDIMLYTSDQMVLFYGSNSWAYTRLGRITDKSKAELKELLGGKGVTVVVSIE